jgi:hypothetical protein
MKSNSGDFPRISRMTADQQRSILGGTATALAVPPNYDPRSSAKSVEKQLPFLKSNDRYGAGSAITIG